MERKGVSRKEATLIVGANVIKILCILNVKLGIGVVKLLQRN